MALSFYVSSSTSSSITIQVSGSGSGTLYCTNGTGQSVSAGSYSFTGLSAGTQYGFRLKESNYLWYPNLNMVCTSSNGVNLRSGPGSSYSKVAGIHNGETITVLSDASSGWCQVSYGSYTGYVAIQYFTTDGAAQSYIYGTTSGSVTSTHYAYLTFSANGGTGAPGNTSVYSNMYGSSVSITIPTTIPTYSGYTFNGWYCAATGGTYQPGGTFTGTGSTSYPGTAYTLVAQWVMASQNPTLSFSIQSTTDNTITVYVSGSGSGILYCTNGTNKTVSQGQYTFTDLEKGTQYGFRLKQSDYVWYPLLRGKCTISGGVRMRSEMDTNSSTVVTIPYGGVIVINAFAGVTNTHHWVEATYNGYSGYTMVKDLVNNIFNFELNDTSVQEYIYGTTTGAIFKVIMVYNAVSNTGSGSGAPNSHTEQGETAEVSVTIPGQTPTLNNYTFLGWSESKSATTASYLANQTYTFTGTKEGTTITLYAVYKKASGGSGVYIYIYGSGWTKATPYAWRYVDGTGYKWVEATPYIYNGKW